MTFKVEFVKYTRERLPEFRTETMICSDENGRFVVKRPLEDAGREHVRGLAQNAELLRRTMPGVNVPSTVVTDEGVRIDFVSGTPLQDLIVRRAARGDREGVLSAIRDMRTYLETLSPPGTARSMTGGVAELLSGAPTEMLGRMMPVANVDITFDNVLIDLEGRYWMTDQEWVFDSPIPISFVMYRSLYVLYLKHERRLAPLLGFPEALVWVGVERDLWQPFRESCERFIDMVLGKDRPHVIPDRYRKRTHGMASRELLQEREQQLYAMGLELEATRNALQEMMSHARSREDRLQEQERALGERAKEVEALRSALAEKESSLNSLSIELRSEELRHKATHAQLEIERDHAYHLIDELSREKGLRAQVETDLAALRERNDGLSMELGALRSELRGERLLSEQLGQELELARTDLRIAIEALARKERELADVLRERDENFIRLQDMTERFMSKQAELMTMSDWARSMHLRLEFLESVPTIRFAERMARAQKLALEKLRSEGVLMTMKGAALKAAPRKVRQMLDRQQPSNMNDLIEESRGRDLLVVFPVIPWEFRWQRPQQLVSRFADNGHTVLYINMTLNPKGSRYLNDLEALKDVRLGKLREHVFDVHLSAFGKVNVYQDRLRGADLSNLARGLLSVLRGLEPASITYLVQFPGWGQLASVMRAKMGGTLIFDCMDDHAGFSNNATEVVRRETKLMEKADLVIASSARLHEKALSFNENSILVRNGTDFDMFHKLSPNGKLDHLKRPIIGYHGAISEWFDPGVVQRCAERRPEWTFVLIGSTLGCEVNGLRRLPNVHLLGEVPYRDLPGYLHYFDVCIIPFKVCELTLATNPVKFYEYISSGKPVVSVRLPEMERYADICYLYEDDEGFEKGVMSALQEGDEGLKAKRITVARDSSWDQRFSEIREHLRRMKEGKGRKVL